MLPLPEVIVMFAFWLMLSLELMLMEPPLLDTSAFRVTSESLTLPSTLSEVCSRMLPVAEIPVEAAVPGFTVMAPLPV